MRAPEPDQVGAVVRDGVRAGYEVHGIGEPTILLLTSWAIVHMRQWKAQVAYLARHFRVVTVEGRGNGEADRPCTDEAYADREYVEDAVAVMDACGIDRAVLVGLSLGARHALQLAAWHPARATGVVAIGAAVHRLLVPSAMDEVRDTYIGWEKANRHYWRADYRGWVEFFTAQAACEPHSTKQWEDLVGWGLQTDAETLLHTVAARGQPSVADAEVFCRAVRCPVLLVHGDQDAILPYESGVALADWTGGNLVTVPGGATSSRTRSDPACRRYVSGRRRTTRSPATSAARVLARTVTCCGPGSAGATTSWSVWCRPAAAGWVAPCCAGWPRPSRPPPSGSRSCGWSSWPAPGLPPRRSGHRPVSRCADTCRS